MRVLALADQTDPDGGHVTERLRQRGAQVEMLHRASQISFETAAGSGSRPSLVLLLGSARAAHDPAHVYDVMAESRLVREALLSGVPVMGIGFGVQLMARALGGTSFAMDAPELGWRRVDTVDEVLCPPGPWAQFHGDAFSPPPTAQVLGSSWYGPQCFVDDSHGAKAIGWQFHPEVTPETFSRWVDASASVVRRSGEDPSDLKREARAQAASSRNRARALVDAALDYLEVSAVDA